MKKITYLFFLLFVCATFTGISQEKKTSNFSKNLWTKTNSAQLEKEAKVHRSSQPSDFSLYQLNLQALKNKLQNAPMRGELTAKNSPIKISFPNSKGEFEGFSIIETPAMEEDLAKKMPMIKAYAGQGIEDPSATIRFTVTQFGLHTMTLSGTKRSWFIEPFTENRLNYIVYSKDALGIDIQGFECLTEGLELPSLKQSYSSQNAVNDSKLRTYRLAQSCTGEYGAIFAGSGTTAQRKANVQAQMTITMTRVNGIYERDLATTMIFVANNDDVIYLNSGTDPWSNEWNTQTAVTLDAVIGVNNYDIGHNFNTTGGGNAGCLGCVCTSNSQSGTHKGRGYTGRADPTGDPFDVDYVAHEMGHQFNGYHTMNTCSRSGSGATEVEPASGSTIMGYAGICSSNVQNNSDAYFNYVNIRDISANIKTGPSSTCDVETNIGNSAPTANAGSNYTIPISTPYMLIGSSTDADGTASHTFTWEQNDPEQAPNGQAPPAANSTTGPMVRSFLGTTNPIRYIPRLQDLVVTGGSTTWEVLPARTRAMEFALTVRDNNAAGGQTADDLMTVNTNIAAGPFTVSSQNSNTVWAQGSTQTITWNVAGTNVAPINAANVDIYLSKDGGLTYPTVLATATPNDGSHNVIIPSGESNNCRIMVKGSNNIFFNINSANIEITGSAAPVISYTNLTANVTEGSDCNYTDVTVPLTITQSPSASATVNFAVTSGNATNGSDYELLNANATFANGATAAQDLVIRVYHDSFVESDETITINFTVNTNGGDATEGNNSFTLTIIDDDLDPTNSGALATIFSDDFESGLGQWTVTGNGTTNFAVYNNTSFPDAGYFSSDQTNTTQYAAVNDDDCNCNMNAERIASNGIALTAGVEYTITFDYAFDNRYVGDTAFIQVSTDNQVTWSSGVSLPPTIVGGSASNVPFLTYSLTYTPTANETASFSILYGDNGGWGQGMLLDNFLITAPGTVSIQTAVNNTTSNNVNLPSIGLAYAYDLTSGDLMLNYNNVNGFDYGCVDASVERAGLNAQPYLGSLAPALVTDKVFNVAPTNTTANTPTEITFYLTKDEIEGWETATGLSRNNLFAYRSGSDDVILLSNSAFGTDVAFTGTFSGLNGTYYFGPETAFRTTVSPKVFLQGAAINPNTGEETLMRDDLRVAGLIPTTSPYGDGLTIASSVLNATGPNAIVDWVYIELRDAGNSATITTTQSALLQRDGDVVAVDGVSNIVLNVPSKAYYVTVNHRNHMSIMSANTISLTDGIGLVNFTGTVSTFGTNAQTTNGMPTGIAAMWTGNVNGDNQVRYQGSGNDSNTIKDIVLAQAGNTSNSNLFQFTGYNNGDLNLDGTIRYQGANNDTNTLKDLILAHPENSGSSNIFSFSKQY